MGMSLDMYIYYGYDAGWDEEFDDSNFEDDFDIDEYGDSLEILKIEASHYYDYTRCFFVIKTDSTSAYDGSPFALSKLPPTPILSAEELNKVERDKKKIEADLGIELSDSLDWLFAPSYW